MNWIIEKLLKSISPQQVCWLCLLATTAGGLYGVNTFAKNSDVTTIRIELLQARLLDLKLRQCAAIKEGHPAVFFAAQIGEQTDKYVALTGRRPTLPTCGEL